MKVNKEPTADEDATTLITLPTVVRECHRTMTKTARAPWDARRPYRPRSGASEGIHLYTVA
jgi:hypothetical protein